MSSRNKIYFASDFHLGVPDRISSLAREKKLVSWFESIKNDAAEIFLMGDVFDFWFEYRTVIPKGYSRLFGKIAELTDSGIKVHLFRGNHDIWAFNYLNEELNIIIHRKPEVLTYNSKKFYLSHGDGLGPGDRGYKLLKKIFENRLSQWLFRWIHPDIGARIALYFSRKSRIANMIKEGKSENQIPLEKEILYQHSLSILNENANIDFLIFGHRHMPIKHPLNSRSTLIILGDWITNFTYAVFDGKSVELKKFETK